MDVEEVVEDVAALAAESEKWTRRGFLSRHWAGEEELEYGEAEDSELEDEIEGSAALIRIFRAGVVGFESSSVAIDCK